MRRHLGLIAALLLVGPGTTLRAEEPPALLTESGETCCECDGGCSAKPWQVMLGYRTWFSWGNADDLAEGISRFKFRDTYSTIYEFNVDAAWNRLVSRVDLGFGGLQGNFREEDTSTGDNTPLENLIGDDVFYVTTDFGYRVVRRGDLHCRGCAVDFLVGYQHWQERYDFGPGNVDNLDEYRWDSVRVGLRGLAARDRLLLQGRFMVVPYAHFESETARFLIKADGSWGLMTDFSASYRFWKDLSLELGYQAFFLDSGPGSFDGAPDFQGSRHVRHGILLGLNWRF